MEAFHLESWKPIFDAYIAAEDRTPIIEANVACLELVSGHLDRYVEWANERGIRVPEVLIAFTRHLENVARAALKA